MLPNMEKDRLFTIIYCLCRYFNLCQCCLKWKKLGAIMNHCLQRCPLQFFSPHEAIEIPLQVISNLSHVARRALRARQGPQRGAISNKV